MLKIKDNIDLKELEKYGFEKDGYNYYYDFIPYKENEGQYILFDVKEKKLYLNYIDIYYFDEATNILYDLIKADLVEKVDD